MTDDPDVGLTPRERTRQALHRSIAHILRAWPHALDDLDARGYSTVGEKGNVGELTSVEAAAITVSRATTWLAELHDVQILLFTGRITPGRGANYRGSFYLTNQTTFAAFAPVYADLIVDQWPPWAEPCCRRMITLANQANLWWPAPPARGTNIAGVTVGGRANNVETCRLCGDPVPDKIRRVDGEPFHANTCYYQVWRQRHQPA